MLEFTVQVSEADYYAANAKLFLKGWAPRKILLGFVCSTIMLGSAAYVAATVAAQRADQDVASSWPTYELLALAVGAGLAALFMAARFATSWYQLPRGSNTYHAETGTLMLPTSYRLSPQRFHCSFEEGSSDHPWMRFLDYVDAGSVLTLRRKPGFLYIIPKHQLTAQQLEELTALLVEVGIKRG